MARGRVESALQGDRELAKALAMISEDMVDKIAPSGMGGYLRVVAKGIKAEIPSSIKDARRGIGSRFVKKDKRSGKVVAKAGVNVAKSRSKQKAEGAKVAAKRGNRPGVGISAANLHWVIKGTSQRTRKNGGPTGAMPAIHPNIIPVAVGKTKSQALAKFKELTAKAMKREAAKVRKKAGGRLLRKLTSI